MASDRDLHLRDRRDQLIDLLKLGQTYPLQDTPLYLPAHPYLVTFENPARIGVESSQTMVLYQLHEAQQLVVREAAENGNMAVPVERTGNRSRILLSSDNIREDKRFQVHAAKYAYQFSLAADLAADLDRAEASAALRQAFAARGHPLGPQITISREDVAAPLRPAMPNRAVNGRPSFAWLLREGNDARIEPRFMIRRQDDRLAVYAAQGRMLYLHQAAEVKVGLDRSLAAWLSGRVAPLDSADESQPQTAARITDYGTAVIVEIENSQEGVFYRPIAGELDASGAYPVDSAPALDRNLLDPAEDEGDGLGKLGTGENIRLTTTPMTEDIDIRIRATKTFPEAADRESETALLSVILPLRVRANLAIAVTVTPSPIVDYDQTPDITVAEAEASVVYSLYRRRILDREFIHGPTETDVLTVDVPDEEAVKVPRPARFYLWHEQAGFTGSGDPLPGAGNALMLPLDTKNEDSVIIIKAEKAHRLETFDLVESRLIPSAVQLIEAAVVLVRPNPDQAVRLEARVTADQTHGEVTVYDGQPGVFYTLRSATEGEAPLDAPIYFHQRADDDADQNKGLDQIRIGVDYVIARTHPGGAPLDPARAAPAPPVLNRRHALDGIPQAVEAQKAQTLVQTPVARTITLASLPEIRPEAEIVDYNGQTRLLVLASIEGDRYQPFLHGEIFKQGRRGNGQDLVFRTDRLIEDTVYEMAVTQPDSGELALTRIVELTVFVRPDPSLQLSLSAAVIGPADGTTVRVHASQTSVRYQLLLIGFGTPRPIGVPVPGNGGTIELATGLLTESTTFGVRAVKASNANATVDLAATVTVDVQDFAEDG